MRFPSVRPRRPRRLGGSLAVLALAAGSLVAVAGPAGAASAAGGAARSAHAGSAAHATAAAHTTAARTAPAVAGDCEPSGSVTVDPSTVNVGGQVTVGWSATGIAPCRPSIFLTMSGPGFNGDEVVGTSGSRTVTLTQPGTALWLLNENTSLGRTELARNSATVIQPILAPGLAGGAVAVADFQTAEQKAEAASIITGNGPSVASGTSPSLFNVGSDYEVANHAVDGFLWLVAPDGTASDTFLGLAEGTSPSITATDGGNFTVAFAANTGTPTGDLWTFSSATGAQDLRLPVFQGTSPGVTTTESGVAIAFADSNDDLSALDPVFGFGGFGSPHAPLAAGTSPVITYIPGQADGYEIAYQSPDQSVRTADSHHSATFPTALTARAGTSPSIAPAAGGGAVTAFQNLANGVSTFTPSAGITVTGLSILPNSSPAIAQITSTAR